MVGMGRRPSLSIRHVYEVYFDLRSAFFIHVKWSYPMDFIAQSKVFHKQHLYVFLSIFFGFRITLL